MVYETKVINGKLVSYNKGKNTMYVDNSWENVPKNAKIETYTPTKYGLNIIVNGSLNKLLTYSHISGLDSYTTSSVRWKMNYATKDEFKTDSNELKDIYDAYKKSIESDKVQKDIANREKGRQAYKMLRSLGLSGRLELNAEQVCGYNLERGQWNDFKPSRVNNALRQMDALIPMDIEDVNNPNYGIKRHTIDVKDDYIIFTFNFINEERANKIKDWAETCKKFKGKLACDSYRFELEKIEGPYNSYFAELYLWWD